ncbi:MAG: hypothetical protein NZM43_10780 [Saprospiraceae bacterium]|nr:hypothetical protein [Saprospiraceae bacterium]MDW8484791.1 formyltransferase family protein [Saprospiraceae bacterium]
MAICERIAVFGCKATTRFLLEHLDIPYPIRFLITLSAEAGIKHQVADYFDLKPWAEARGMEVYQARYYSLRHPDDLAYLKRLELDLAFVIGWQRLLPAEVLSALRIGAFGMHGSAVNLPRGRGRSPMNWSLIEGRQAFYTNLFLYDPGVDSGDIVDTFKFQITPHDTAETLHFKNTLAMKYLIERNIEALVHNEFRRIPQDISLKPTYYPKRTPDDGLIDWELDVYALERFIRAVTRPFSGAFTFVNEEIVRIWRAQVFDLNDFGYERALPGTVVAVFERGNFLVKCLGGLLLVTEYESKAAIKRHVRFSNNGRQPRRFPRNPQGFFDLSEADTEENRCVSPEE